MEYDGDSHHGLWLPPLPAGAKKKRNPRRSRDGPRGSVKFEDNTKEKIAKEKKAGKSEKEKYPGLVLLSNVVASEAQEESSQLDMNMIPFKKRKHLLTIKAQQASEQEDEQIEALPATEAAKDPNAVADEEKTIEGDKEDEVHVDILALGDEGINCNPEEEEPSDPVLKEPIQLLAPPTDQDQLEHPLEAEREEGGEELANIISSEELQVVPTEADGNQNEPQLPPTDPREASINVVATEVGGMFAGEDLYTLLKGRRSNSGRVEVKKLDVGVRKKGRKKYRSINKLYKATKRIPWTKKHYLYYL